MRNRLFIICPYSRLEPDLQKEFGNSICFLTSPLASIETDDIQFLKALKCKIETEKITEIIIVNSTTCRFINGILNNSNRVDFRGAEILQELYYKNQHSTFSGLDFDEKAFKLAELNISYQTLEILQSNILGSYILKRNIEIDGLIISKNKTEYTQIKLTHEV